MLATAVPGIGRFLSEELASIHGLTVRDEGFDGRADVVLYEADPATTRSVPGLRLSEDVFVEVGRTLRSEGDRPAWIAGRLWRREPVRRALAARAAITRLAAQRTTYRVVVRIRQERSFLRTDLRRDVERTVGREHPDWRLADPAQLEVWVTEFQPGRLVAALRLTDARMRQHDGRAEERPGALRPTVAAAMIRLAGPPGVLLDPCCGSGTILAEAGAVGWDASGTDVDAGAIRAARRNVPGARIDKGDARSLSRPDHSVDAVVSNLPFGQRYTVDGSVDRWQRDALGEMSRVVRPGGRIVLLTPTVLRSATPARWSLTERQPLRLLGLKTALWAYTCR